MNTWDMQPSQSGDVTRKTPFLCRGFFSNENYMQLHSIGNQLPRIRMGDLFAYQP
jgi:hypothetical protein